MASRRSLQSDRSTGYRRILIAGAVLLVCCAGRVTSENSTPDGVASGGAGGSGPEVAGATESAAGGAGDALPSGERDAGVLICFCELVPDAACDISVLRDAIAVRFGADCHFSSVEDGGGADALVGTIVVDSEGRLVDNTALEGTAKQYWLEKFGNRRWPCKAGQTLEYVCHVRIGP